MVEGKAIVVFTVHKDRVSVMPLLIIVYPKPRKMGRKKERRRFICGWVCCSRLFVKSMISLSWISFTVPLSLSKSVHLAVDPFHRLLPPITIQRLQPVSSAMKSALKWNVLAKCSTTKARAAILTLPHGPVNAPVFMPVGTQGTLKGITPEQLEGLGCQIMLNNTYHLVSIKTTAFLSTRWPSAHSFPILTAFYLRVFVQARSCWTHAEEHTSFRAGTATC